MGYFLKYGLPGIALLLILVALLLPIGPVPGFRIGGEATPVPDDWGDTSAIDEIRLQVGEGAIKRVVIIWVIQVDGALHVVGSRESGWTQMLGEGGPVRLRIDQETYDLTATRLGDGLKKIYTAYIGKYQDDYPDIIAGFPPFEEARDGTAVYRLAPR